MSYLSPASFHFVRGIIKGTKGSDIANLASLEVLALRYAASKIYYHKACRSKYGIKIPHSLFSHNSCYVKCHLWGKNAYFIIKTKYGVFMNFLDKPFITDSDSVLPPYPFYGYDNSEELDKDVEYMKNLYSRTLKMLQKEVDEECDKLEYAGSCMFDAFPDQVHLGTIIDRIYDRMQNMNWDMDGMLQAEQVGNPGYRPPMPPPRPMPCQGNNCPPPQPCQGPFCPPPPRPSRPPMPPRPDYRPDGRPDWMRDLIASLLYNEMIHRRRRYRSRNRWNRR